MATTNSTAVNSSNHSSIGMVSFIFYYWPRFIKQIYPVFLHILPYYISGTDHSNHDENNGAPLPEEKIFKDDELVNMIDPILATDDKNQDGYIDYPEFVQAQQAAQARQAQV